MTWEALKQAATLLKGYYGLNFSFSLKIIWLAVLAWYNNIGISVVSGYRASSYQKELQARWDRGDRAGLAVRPADYSKHSNTDLSGDPDSLAVDLASGSSQDLRNLGYLAVNYCGLKWGGTFASPDPAHFYV